MQEGSVKIFYFKIIFKIYFILAVLGLCCFEDFPLGVVCGLITTVASLSEKRGPQGTRASGVVAPGSRAQVQQMWRTGLDAPCLVRSSWTREQTHVSCIGRQILYH